LADPAETALWQIELDKISEGTLAPEVFTTAIKQRVSEYIAALAPVASVVSAASMGLEGKGTGVRLPAVAGGEGPELIEFGEYFTAEGYKGRFYKDAAGVTFTARDIAELVSAEDLGIERSVPSKFKGKPPARVKIRYDAAAQPYPKVVVEWPKAAGTATEGTPTGVQATWGKVTGEISDWGTFYTVAGWNDSDGKPWRLFKKLASHELTPAEIAAILAGGKQGARMTRTLFKNGSGQPFGSDPIVIFNTRKKPAGFEFDFQ